MPEIHALLAGAARPPAGELDLAAVVRRGRVLRRQRYAAVGAVALLALAVPVGVLAGGSTGGDDELVPTPGVTTTTAPPAPEPSRGGGTPADTEATGPGATAGATSTPIGTPSANGTPAPGDEDVTPMPSASARSTTQGPVAAEYPPKRGCEVRTVALAPGQSATCRYTATAAGGWEVSYDGVGVFAGDYEHDVRVVITRDGQRFVSTEECGTQQIEVGDRVSITIEQYESGVSDDALHAGPGYGC
jgi:hypothetical protein